MNIARAHTQDGGLLAAFRTALLADRECKVPNSTEKGHIARKWHICPVCFPEKKRK